jgi:hypothetical protein
MSYSATTPTMSKVQAQKFGAWLARYKIDVVSLTCWQVGQSGRLYKDQPLADTITMVVGSAGGSLASGASGAAVGTVAAPVLAPLAALLAPIMPALLIATIASWPLQVIAFFKLRQSDAAPMESVVRDDPIVATLLKWGFGNVSDKRRKWVEYATAVYAGQHSWHTLRGWQYPAQIELGMNYAARGGALPSWSETPRSAGGRPQKAKAKTSKQTVGRARRAWWRILDEL